MALTPQVLTDARIYYASLDATGYSNKVEFDVSVEDLDKTTFASGGSKERVGALFDMTSTGTMFWQPGDLSQPDDVLWSTLGLSAQPLTVCPTSGAVGTLAYLTKTLESAYKPSGDVGKLVMAEATWLGNQAVARGQILHPQGTARTSTGTGTAVNLGAVLAGQRMYVNLHVLGVSGTTPSMIVKLQSAPTSGFTSPTDQVTLTAATTYASQAASVLGPVTDAWWRVSWTITGTTPSFLFAASAGIAAK